MPAGMPMRASRLPGSSTRKAGVPVETRSPWSTIRRATTPSKGALSRASSRLAWTRSRRPSSPWSWPSSRRRSASARSTSRWVLAPSWRRLRWRSSSWRARSRLARVAAISPSTSFSEALRRRSSRTASTWPSSTASPSRTSMRATRPSGSKARVLACRGSTSPVWRVTWGKLSTALGWVTLTGRSRSLAGASVAWVLAQARNTIKATARVPRATSTDGRFHCSFMIGLPGCLSVNRR